MTPVHREPRPDKTRLMTMKGLPLLALAFGLLPVALACGGSSAVSPGAAQAATSRPSLPGGVVPSATSSSGLRVPEEFLAACGKPGATVRTERRKVTVRHADCDLTGVVINGLAGGTTVPKPGVGVGSSSGVSISVDEVTGDTTFSSADHPAQL